MKRVPPAVENTVGGSRFFRRPLSEIPALEDDPPLPEMPADEEDEKEIEVDVWSGWDETLPPEYLVCPSCLAAQREQHLPGCPYPDMKAIGWHCPLCDAAPKTRHMDWCSRKKGQSESGFFLERSGFAKQIIYGRGHPTPLLDAHGGKSLARIQIYLAAQRGDYIAEPWRVPTLRDDERALVRENGRAE